ncbi:hypothetical protein HYPSUDRAFT_202853 [Hypholoma sublateritium FD-334 SS-4]|uniref:Uncharacterized protein n=1 Tax=Hypholoma sublateritium (strain FD-334 SS-4) TaxID=945553 RepID=A0A0D2L3W3_HYPSF|nr:hypothetical protein HYPSUDRAFT_202853 [Hypholoma sublateritium FD-334 SS-4]
MIARVEDDAHADHAFAPQIALQILLDKLDIRSHSRHPCGQHHLPRATSQRSAPQNQPPIRLSTPPIPPASNCHTHISTLPQGDVQCTQETDQISVQHGRIHTLTPPARFCTCTTTTTTTNHHSTRWTMRPSTCMTASRSRPGPVSFSRSLLSSASCTPPMNMFTSGIGR